MRAGSKTAILLAVALFACGCGGKQDRAAVVGDGIDGDVHEVPAHVDHSTGVALPAGPGDGSPAEHVISANARGIYNEGVEAAAAGRFDQAEQAFIRTLQIDPRAHRAAYNLGVIAERRGRIDDARGHYRKVLELQPNYLPAISALANLEILYGDSGAALDLLRAKAESYPRDPGILNRYADALIIARRYKDAIDVAKQSLRIDERNAEAMLCIGKANLRQGRNELAQAVFDQVLSINPDEAEVFFLRSTINLADGNRAEAIRNLGIAIEKRPTHVEAMNNLAVQYLVSGNYDEAISQLEKALQLAPAWSVLRLNYGNALRGAGRWTEARAELERARALDAKLVGVLFNLGLLYYAAGENYGGSPEDLDNLDRLGRFKRARRHFADYKTEMGPALTKRDEVHRYDRELKLAIEREERRLKQAQEQAELEARREAERAAAAAAGEAGDDPAEEEEWEEEEEEFWE